MQKIAVVIGDRPMRGNRADDELVEVLITLGYRRLEAETAARDASEVHGDVEERLKIALRNLAR